MRRAHRSARQRVDWCGPGCFHELVWVPLEQLVLAPLAPDQDRIEEKNREARGGARWSCQTPEWGQKKLPGPEPVAENTQEASR
jgi:hypothetical protein